MTVLIVLSHIFTVPLLSFFFFFFNDTATTEIYTLSLHDALPISVPGNDRRVRAGTDPGTLAPRQAPSGPMARSEEHTSELQSQSNLVCRLLLEKKKKKKKNKEQRFQTHSAE